MKRADFQRVAWCIKHTDMQDETRKKLLDRIKKEFQGDHDNFNFEQFVIAASPEKNEKI